VLSEYIQAAMRQAHYEIMEDRRIFGTIPPCQGVWADADTVEECREKLRTVLEGWLLLGFELGHPTPVIDGIDLNRKPVVHAEADQAA